MTRDTGAAEERPEEMAAACLQAELLNREQETLYKWLYKNHPVVVSMTRQKWKSTFQ